MKRDMDLVREILLAIEGGQTTFGREKAIANSDATSEEIADHLRLLEQAGYLDIMGKTIGGSVHLRGLSWQGCEFIDTVRDPEVWKRTKEGASKMGGWSVSLLKDLGTAYLKHVAKERLGLDL